MLYVVPTPIGNLEDLSARALRTLREVRAIYCEDTRRTRKLLAHHGLGTPLIRYQDRDERSVERILSRLAAGEDLALVSDSGTPVISDPGLRLVALARARDLPVCPLPGPCAAATAVAGSGLPGDAFVFLGFLPRSRSKQRRALEAAAAMGKTIVVYESPYRVLNLLGRAEEALGADAQAVACRELSKVHEEWLTGSVGGVRRVLESRGKLLGEFVLMFHPAGRRAA
ncbi:MAG: 16S rRNA (cytidine(1402)-2'-O)-methyltransferase [Elusimicrobiota bacterium]